MSSKEKESKSTVYEYSQKQTMKTGFGYNLNMMSGNALKVNKIDVQNSSKTSDTPSNQKITRSKRNIK